uniref:Apolipoprotein C-I-like n=1 Tax=Scleropages formosus TaxID=113540 RepID=A0A8C9VPT9_SCLFO
MKVLLAVAVLVLVLVHVCGPTEAEEEPTLQEHFTNLQQHVKDLGESFLEKAKAAIQKIQESTIATNARNWLNEQMEKLMPKDS